MSAGPGGMTEAFQLLLDQSHIARVEDIPDMLQAIAPLVGASELTVHLADYGQRLLVPLVAGAADPAEPMAIDATLAGRSYRDVSVYLSGDDQSRRVWLPLLDGTERLGVLEAVMESTPDDEAVDQVSSLAGLIAELLMTRSSYGDAFELAKRRLPMSLGAELQWGLLPPLTFATRDVVISAVLEPCYDIGGDTFDYAVNGTTLHAAIFDAVGHGIDAAQLVGLTVAAYRNARRSGLDLKDTAQSIDRWVSSQFPQTFVTGILLELDTRTGQLHTVNAGHPAALLFRGSRLVRELPGPTRLPFGLGASGEKDDEVAAESMQRGDRVLLFSDGIVEARAIDGEEFGLDRLVDFVCRELVAKLPPPETMRRLIHAILEHQHDELQDDGTAVLIEWSQAAVARTVGGPGKPAP